MAHIASPQTNPQALAQRALAAVIGAFQAVRYFFAVMTRATATQTLMTQSEVELAARGLTRQQLVDYIIDGSAPR